MSRLVIASDKAIDPGTVFYDLLVEVNIHPDRQSFLSGIGSAKELYAKVAELGSEFILLCGNGPLQLVRPDLNTQFSCGIPFWVESGENEWGALATINPEALQRNPAWKSSVSAHLDSLKEFARRPEDMLSMTPECCARCGSTPRSSLDDSLIWLCKACETRDVEALVNDSFGE